MTQRSTTREAGPVEDRLEPMQATDTSGGRVGDLGQPIEYLAYERDGIRHGWTVEPDDAGRYHALTLQWQDDAEGWAVTAAQPFDTSDTARSWAERLDHESEGAKA